MAVIKAQALRDVRIQRVSLVDRGANRTPFRIMKREQGASMSIFDKIFKTAKAEAPKPVVTAIAVAKTANQEETKERIAKSGFSVENPFETESVVIYRQPGAPDKLEGIVIKFDENVAAVISNVTKGLFGGDPVPASFAEMVVDNCVFPGIFMALDTLCSSLVTNLRGAESPEQAVAKIDEVFTDAATYMKGLMSAIPAEAFKFEDLIRKEMTKPTSSTGKFPNEPSGRDHGQGASDASGDAEDVKNGKKPPKDKSPKDGTGKFPNEGTEKDPNSGAAPSSGGTVHEQGADAGASGVRSGQTASGNESVHRDSAHTSRKEEGEEKSGEAAKTEEKVEEKAVVAKTAAENMAAEDRPTATLLDMSVTKQVQSMTPSKNGKVPADPSIEDAVDGKSANGAASKPSGDTVAKGATCDESDDEEQDAEGNPIKAKNKKKDEGEDALAKILKAVQDMRAETTSALKEVQETVEDLEGRVAKSEEDTRVVAAKLKATIPSVAASEDPPQRRSMKRAFVTDTAFQRDIQTSA